MRPQLLSKRVPPQGVMRQVKLWGNTTEPILQVAGRTRPQTLAQLLHDAIAMDQHNKSGVGEPERNLEAFMVRIADTIGR